MTKIDCMKQYLIRCCYWYYVKSQPLISDSLYDALFRDLGNREMRQQKATGKEPSDDSPTQIIWGDSDSQYPDWAKERKDMECCTE